MVHDFLTSNTQHLKASLVSLSYQLLLQLFSAHGASCYSRKKKKSILKKVLIGFLASL